MADTAAGGVVSARQRRQSERPLDLGIPARVSEVWRVDHLCISLLSGHAAPCCRLSALREFNLMQRTARNFECQLAASACMRVADMTPSVFNSADCMLRCGLANSRANSAGAQGNASPLLSSGGDDGSAGRPLRHQRAPARVGFGSVAHTSRLLARSPAVAPGTLVIYDTNTLA